MIKIEVLILIFLVLIFVISCIICYIKNDNFSNSSDTSNANVFKENPVKIAAIINFPKVNTYYPNNNFILKNDYNYNYHNGVLLANMINSVLITVQDCPKTYICNSKNGLLEYVVPQKCELIKKLYISDDEQNKRFFGVLLKQNNNLIIALRGTATEYEWQMIDKHAFPPKYLKDGHFIASGFYKVANEVYNQIIDLIKLENYNHLWITGHSLGAATTTILSYLLSSKINKRITVYTFGCPRCVSELISNQISNDVRINFYRVVNIEDNVPPSIPSSTSIPIFKHVGNLINYSYFGKSSGENHGFYLKEYLRSDKYRI